MEKAVKKISPSDPNNTFVLPATSRVDYLNKICDVLVRKTQTLKELLPNLENATNAVIAILQQNPLLQIAKWKIYISQWMDFYTAFFDESEYLRVGHATREYHVLESARFFASRGKNNANVSNRCNFPTSVLSKAGLEYALWKCQVFLHFQFLFHFIFFISHFIFCFTNQKDHFYIDGHLFAVGPILEEINKRILSCQDLLLKSLKQKREVASVAYNQKHKEKPIDTLTVKLTDINKTSVVFQSR